MGGFYFSSYYEQWMKRWWIRFNLLCSVISVGTCIGYLGTMKNSDFGTTFYVIFIMDVCITSVLFIPSVTYYFKKELKSVLCLNENECVKIWTEARSLSKIIKILFGMEIAWIGGIILLHVLIPLFATNEEYLQDEKYYYAPNPAILYMDSEFQYISVTIFSALFSLPLFLICFSPSVFVLIIAHEFYLKFANLCRRVAKFSAITEKYFFNLNENFYGIGMNEEVMLGSFNHQNKTEKGRQKLKRNIINAIKDFQELIRKLSIVKTYIQFQFSLLMIMAFSAQLFIISSFYSADMNEIQKIKGFMLLNLAGVWWMCYCYAGRVLTDTGEMMAKQVFGIPWFYLDSSGRKTFYVFLYLAQRPVRFYGNRIYVMGMPLFLHVLNLSYSYFNFLRTMSRK